MTAYAGPVPIKSDEVLVSEMSEPPKSAGSSDEESGTKADLSRSTLMSLAMWNRLSDRLTILLSLLFRIGCRRRRAVVRFI